MGRRARGVCGAGLSRLVLLGTLAALVAACDAGTAPPEPNVPQEETAMTFTLSSPDFASGGPIPRRHTCDGADTSPALAWSGAPGGTAAFALIVDDPDARGFVHWVLFDLGGDGAGPGPTASAGSARESAPVPAPAAGSGTLPGDITADWGVAPQGRNDFGRVGYGGPCPPSGTHRYDFVLYALDKPLGLTGSPSAAEVRRAMEGHILGRATLTGTYLRG